MSDSSQSEAYDEVIDEKKENEEKNETVTSPAFPEKTPDPLIVLHCVKSALRFPRARNSFKSPPDLIFGRSSFHSLTSGLLSFAYYPYFAPTCFQQSE